MQLRIAGLYDMEIIGYENEISSCGKDIQHLWVRTDLCVYSYLGRNENLHTQVITRRERLWGNIIGLKL